MSGHGSIPWTPDRIAYLRHLREDKKLIWAEVGQAMGIKGDAACSAYRYYCDPDCAKRTRGKRKLDSRAPKKVSHPSPPTIGPDDLPIAAGGRVPLRTPPDQAVTRADAPPPSPSARRFRSAVVDDVLLRVAAQGLTAGLFGDPPKGRSALDKKRAGADA